MTFSSLFNDLIVLFAFLLIGFVIREIFKPLQRIYIPASIIGGVIALIVGPQVLGLVSIPESFSSMASVMITLVLTCSVIGVDMDKSKANALLYSSVYHGVYLWYANVPGLRPGSPNGEGLVCLTVWMGLRSCVLLLGWTRNCGQRRRRLGGIWDYRQYLCGHDHVDLGCSFMFRGGLGL